MSIITIQSVVGPNPQKALLILNDTADMIFRQAVVFLQMCEFNFSTGLSMRLAADQKNQQKSNQVIYFHALQRSIYRAGINLGKKAEVDRRPDGCSSKC